LQCGAETGKAENFTIGIELKTCDLKSFEDGENFTSAYHGSAPCEKGVGF